MKDSGSKEQPKKRRTIVKTFPVPFALGEIKEDITNITITNNLSSKEQIIKNAFKFHSQGKISEAVKYYQQFINQGFNDQTVFSNYAAILKDLGNLKEAEKLIRRAIKINPKYADAHYNLGIILNDLGNLKEAIYSYRKAIQLKPSFTNAHYNLGNIFKDLGQLNEAESSINKAIELNPNSANFHSSLGSILRKIGKLQEAEISTRKAIALKPDCANSHSILGNILYDLGELEEAELFQLKAIELKPDFADAYSNLGNVLYDLGKSKEAEINYTNAINLRPDFTDALLNRWKLFFKKGEFKNALRDADLCNTSRSRACAIETLYALGNIEEIYKRIEATSKLDNENIRLAAFSSFIAAKENKNTSNNFCRNPLEFLHFSNFKFFIKDYNIFIKKIIHELAEIKTIWEPPKQATHNGFQTPIHINLFSNSSENISQLKSIVLNELDSYFLKFEKESCSYIQKWPLKKNLKAWHVILKKQGYQEAHIHPAGWLSGVIYLKVVPSLGKNEGAIEFSLNAPNYSDINSPQLIHHPEAGDIVFFPSSLYHRTIPFSTDTDRIVVAFDLMPN